MTLKDKLKDFGKKNFQNVAFLIFFSISFVLSLIIFLTLSGNLSNLEEVDKVSSLISVNFVMIIFLIIFSLNNIFRIFIQKKIKSKFRIQFTLLFIITTFIPTTLITIFSLIFFDQGLKLWFNEKLSQVIKGSQRISESYFSEHENTIKNDILFINSNISNEKIVFFTDKSRLNSLLASFVKIKDLEEAIIFEQSGQLLAKVGSFLIESEPSPPIWAKMTADDGGIAVYPNNDQTKVRALMKLQRVIPTYLYIGKNVDPNVLSRVESVNEAAIEYSNIANKLDEFQFQFNKLFVSINFLMILLSIWFGLRFSNRIIDPIMEIISDSEKIIKGDFSTRIRIFKGNYDFNVLSKVLNKMLDRLHKAKETINLRRKFTENIINDVSTGIIYVDLNDRIVLFNKKSQEILGENLKNEFNRKNNQINSLIKQFKSSDLKIDNTQIKYFSNEKFKILNLKISKFVEKKKQKGIIVTIDDITELVSAQKNAAWSNVARYLAHEIKNPLTPIKLSAQRLENFFKNRGDVDDRNLFFNCTDAIVRQVNNIENLVTEFSNFARMPLSKFQSVKIDKIILTQINTQKIANKNIKFQYSFDPKNILISGDQNQLSRVFLNIFKNSIESMDKVKKKISVEINNNKKFIIVNIEDNGKGFPENRDKLFEPYITNKTNGTGLGLSICKKIIEDHNGEINLLDSKNLGGALVRIKLFKRINQK